MPISERRVTRNSSMLSCVMRRLTPCARQPLRERVHQLAETDLVGRREKQVAETVDDDAARFGPFDASEEVVHPLVDVEVHG